ncbi:hypothetical protein BC828DRAFT_139515 [Blastocladiella britannica]|nr:hypothetical protein BC828DRAFT_139515 [Blastocladiella britannica]
MMVVAAAEPTAETAAVGDPDAMDVDPPAPSAAADAPSTAAAEVPSAAESDSLVPVTAAPVQENIEPPTGMDVDVNTPNGPTMDHTVVKAERVEPAIFADTEPIAMEIDKVETLVTVKQEALDVAVEAAYLSNDDEGGEDDGYDDYDEDDEEDVDDDEDAWDTELDIDLVPIRAIAPGTLVSATLGTSKTPAVFHFHIADAIPAPLISIAAGAFAEMVIPLDIPNVQARPMTLATSSSSSAAPAVDGGDASTNDPTATTSPGGGPLPLAAARSILPERYPPTAVRVYYPAGVSPLAVQKATAITEPVLDYYCREFGMYPWSWGEYRVVYASEVVADMTHHGAGVTIMDAVAAGLTEPTGPDSAGEDLERVVDLRRGLMLNVAYQWMGCFVVPRTPGDYWVIVGLAQHMASRFFRLHFGSAESDYRIKKDIQRLAVMDVYMPPIYYLPHQSLEFVMLKSALVVHALDKRLARIAGGPDMTTILRDMFADGAATSNPVLLLRIEQARERGDPLPDVLPLSTAGMRRWLQRYAASGPWNSFWKHWVDGAGVPRIEIGYTQNDSRQVIGVDITQDNTSEWQRDHGVRGLFEGDFTIIVREIDGEVYKHTVHLNKPVNHFEVKFNSRYKYKKMYRQIGTDGADAPELIPSGAVLGQAGQEQDWMQLMRDSEATGADAQARSEAQRLWIKWVWCDPDLEWPCPIVLKQPEIKWLALMRHPPVSVLTQFDTVSHLRHFPSMLVARELLAIIADRSIFVRLRMDAVSALVACATPEANWAGVEAISKVLGQFSAPSSSSTGVLTAVPQPRDWTRALDEYLLFRTTLAAATSVRNRDGHVASQSKRLAIQLLKYTDAAAAVGPGVHFPSHVAFLVRCLCEAFMVGPAHHLRQDPKHLRQDPKHHHAKMGGAAAAQGSGAASGPGAHASSSSSVNAAAASSAAAAASAASSASRSTNGIPPGINTGLTANGGTEPGNAPAPPQRTIEEEAMHYGDMAEMFDMGGFDLFDDDVDLLGDAGMGPADLELGGGEDGVAEEPLLSPTAGSELSLADLALADPPAAPPTDGTATTAAPVDAMDVDPSTPAAAVSSGLAFPQMDLLVAATPAVVSSDSSPASPAPTALELPSVPLPPAPQAPLELPAAPVPLSVPMPIVHAPPPPTITPPPPTAPTGPPPGVGRFQLQFGPTSDLLDEAMVTLERLRVMEQLMASMHHASSAFAGGDYASDDSATGAATTAGGAESTVLCAILTCYVRWMMAGLIPARLSLLLEYTSTSYSARVRATAFRGLFLLHAFVVPDVAAYLFSIIESDPSPTMRIHVAGLFINMARLVGAQAKAVLQGRRKEMMEEYKRFVRDIALPRILTMLDNPTIPRVVQSKFIQLADLVLTPMRKKVAVKWPLKANAKSAPLMRGAAIDAAGAVLQLDPPPPGAVVEDLTLAKVRLSLPALPPPPSTKEKKARKNRRAGADGDSSMNVKVKSKTKRSRNAEAAAEAAGLAAEASRMAPSTAKRVRSSSTRSGPKWRPPYTGTMPTKVLAKPSPTMFLVGTYVRERLRSQIGFEVFAEPVPPAVPRYYEIITDPMDFKAIGQRLKNGHYANPAAMKVDVDKVWANCVLYNHETSDLGQLAIRLRELSDDDIFPNAVRIFTEETQKLAKPRDITPEQCTTIRSILKAVAEDNAGAAFRQPVTDVVGYYDVISSPMDFGTIRKRVEFGEYPTIGTFEADVQRVFTNCRNYNAPGSPIWKQGEKCSEDFARRWRKAFPSKMVARVMSLSALPPISVSASSRDTATTAAVGGELEPAAANPLRIKLESQPAGGSLSSSPPPPSFVISVKKFSSGNGAAPSRPDRYDDNYDKEDDDDGYGGVSRSRNSASSYHSKPPPLPTSAPSKRSLLGKIGPPSILAGNSNSNRDGGAASASRGGSGAMAPPKTALPPTTAPSSRPLIDRLRHVHKALWENQHSFDFQVPFQWKEAGHLNYPKIIKRPMDLTTIHRKLDKYATTAEFFDDVHLMLRNAITYTTIKEAPVHKAALVFYSFARRLCTDRLQLSELPRKLVAHSPVSGAPTSLPMTVAAAGGSSSSSGGGRVTPSMSPPSSHQGSSSPASTTALPVPPAPPAVAIAAPLTHQEVQQMSLAPMTPWHQAECSAILRRMIVGRDAADQSQSMYFIRPVDPVRENFPNYYSVVPDPMDLGTAFAKLVCGDYATVAALSDDVHCVFSNCEQWTASLDDAPKFRQIAQALRARYRGDVAAMFQRAAALPPGALDVPADVPPTTPLDKKLANKLIGRLKKHRHAVWFTEPVDHVRFGLPEYPHVIKHPMAFSTIADKIKAGKYATQGAFVADVHLVFDNAATFNNVWDEVVVLGREVLLDFEAMCARERVTTRVASKMALEWRDRAIARAAAVPRTSLGSAPPVLPPPRTLSPRPLEMQLDPPSLAVLDPSTPSRKRPRSRSPDPDSGRPTAAATVPGSMPSPAPPVPLPEPTVQLAAVDPTARIEDGPPALKKFKFTFNR